MSSPDPHLFVHAPPDSTAIRDYLNLTDPGEVARLAAALAPRPESFDAGSLVDSAITLRTAADAGLIRQREAMAARMNLETLLALCEQLGCSDKLAADESDKCHSDPVKGPVLRILRSFWDAMETADETKNDAFVRQAFEHADARTKIPRPDLPCDLEPALRYAANARDTPWPVLERAFKDFIGLWRIRHQTERDRKLKEDLDRELAREKECLAKIPRQPSADPQAVEARAGHAKRIKEINARLGDLRSINLARDCFMPGSEIPPSIAKEAARSYAATWQSAGCVWRPEILANLATEFHGFWKEHRSAYLKIRCDEEQARKSLAATNSQSARKAVEGREGAKWTEHTQAFIRFAGSRLPACADPSALIKAYAESHSGTTTKPAQAKVRDFLAAIQQCASRGMDAGKIMDTLHRCEIGSLTDAAVNQCISLLKEAVRPARGKKSKKLG